MSEHEQMSDERLRLRQWKAQDEVVSKARREGSYWSHEEQREWLAEARALDDEAIAQLAQSIDAVTRNGRYNQAEAMRHYVAWLDAHPDFAAQITAMRTLRDYYRAQKQAGAGGWPAGWVDEWDVADATGQPGRSEL